MQVVPAESDDVPPRQFGGEEGEGAGAAGTLAGAVSVGSGVPRPENITAAPIARAKRMAPMSSVVVRVMASSRNGLNTPSNAGEAKRF